MSSNLPSHRNHLERLELSISIHRFRPVTTTKAIARSPPCLHTNQLKHFQKKIHFQKNQLIISKELRVRKREKIVENKLTNHLQELLPFTVF